MISLKQIEKNPDLFPLKIISEDELKSSKNVKKVQDGIISGAIIDGVLYMYVPTIEGPSVLVNAQQYNQELMKTPLTPFDV